MRFLLIAALTLTSLACTKTKEVVVDRTVLVPVTPTPLASSYQPKEIVGLVQQGHGRFFFSGGDASIADGVFDFCVAGGRKDVNAVAYGAWEANLVGPGRWSVKTTCTDKTGAQSTISFEWLFFEDGLRVAPSGGNASNVTR